MICKALEMVGVGRGGRRTVGNKTVDWVTMIERRVDGIVASSTAGDWIRQKIRQRSAKEVRIVTNDRMFEERKIR